MTRRDRPELAASAEGTFLVLRPVLAWLNPLSFTLAALAPIFAAARGSFASRCFEIGGGGGRLLEGPVAR